MPVLIFLAACDGGADLAEADDAPDAVSTVGDGVTAKPAAAAPALTVVGGAHSHCGWIGPDFYEEGVATFLANTSYFKEIHPKWYEIGADSVSIRVLAHEGDARVVDAAAAGGVLLTPMIADNGSKAVLRAMIGDPAMRSAHIQNMVALAVSQNYAGLELDYEHLWSKTDRPGYEAFVTEAANAMHAVGKTLSVTVPGLARPNPDSAYDYNDLAHALPVDVVHIMAYDFHTTGTHEGPVAPLGWVDAVAGQIEATGLPSKFILGLPNYGVTSTWYSNSKGAAAACGNRYSTTTQHMKTCSYGVYNAGTAMTGRAPNCSTSNGRLFFDDLESFRDKVNVAAIHHMGGITHWNLGGEPDGFFAMVQGIYLD